MLWQGNEAHNIRRASMFITQRSLQNTLRWSRRLMVLILIIANLVTVMLADAAPAAQDSQPSFPIRAAFYYPWFPEAWNQQGFNRFTDYTPSLGFYDASRQPGQQETGTNASQLFITTR
jgi:hypothetical protein